MTKGRVLITGGAGFIGSHVVDTLLARGYEPYVVDNLSTGRRENLSTVVPLYEANICDGKKLARIFSEVRPQFVCHQAAQISVSRSVRESAFDASVNILGWLNVLEQCVRVGVERVVFASSGGVLYGDVFEPVDENHPIQPISPYGISKWAGEQYLRFYVREYGIHGIVLRYANVYGPRQNPHGEGGVVAIFAHRMLAGEAVTIFGNGRNIRDYVFVGDVVRATALALGSALDKEFVALNIGTGTGTDVNRLETQMRSLVGQLRNKRGTHGVLPRAKYDEPCRGELRSSLLSAGWAQALLQWRPQVPLEQGL